MNKIKIISENSLKIVFILLFTAFSVQFASVTKDKNGKKTLSKSNEALEFFVFDINNLTIPLNNEGVIADVDPGGGAGGEFDNDIFLYSSGFFVSGMNGDKLFGNGVLSASRIQDYQPGPVGSSKFDSKNGIYVVSQQDQPFGDTWQEWIDAVSLGADFYDGDGDGVYNPVDKNGNGKWDTNEDRPDILGDVTAWSVFNDGVPSALRRFGVNPLGLEIHQSVFGFKSKSIVGNMMFVRYRIINTGTVSENLTDMYFSAAADPDLGDYEDDLVGCDIDLSAGFVYNRDPDSQYGENAPCFLMDFFQGPIVSIPGETFVDDNGNGVYDEGETALDTAYAVKGQQIGIEVYPGSRNLPLSSMTQYMQSHPTHGDPNTHFELRNYMLGGKGKEGDSLYVSTWTFGNGADLGADTANTPAHFMYSGEPEAGTGWLNTEPIDQRIMMNTGPFSLAAGEHQDIIVAYVVGRGETGLNSVTVAKENDITAQTIFDNNFPAPPPPSPVDLSISSGDGYIDIMWETADIVNYVAVDTVLFVNKKFEGFYLTAFATPSKETSINGVNNVKELESYELDNVIDDIFVRSKNGNEVLLRKAANIKLDSLIYGDPAQGRILYRVTEDPFTGGKLVPGTQYYFAVGTYTIDHNAIVNRETEVYGDPGDYIDPTNSAFSEFETSILTVVYGENEYDPLLPGDLGSQASGASGGEVKYLVVDKESLTGDEYEVKFNKADDSQLYSTYWSLENKTQSVTLIDSSSDFSFDDTDVSGVVYDGFLVKVKEVTPELYTEEEYQDSFNVANKWFKDFNNVSYGGVYYVGEDIAELQDDFINPIKNPLFPPSRSTVISAADLRRVELRFNESSMAYRYLNGFEGSILKRKRTYVYAEGVSSEDTVRSGIVGQWDEANDHAMGLVEVPFSAYVVDNKHGESRKLAVGFIERSSAEFYGSGTPDGVWDPTDSLRASLEIIIIFDEDYDENPNSKIYKGGLHADNRGNTVWADIINGYDLPTSVEGVTVEDSIMAASPFFNAMYTVNLERDIHKDSAGATYFSESDVLTIGVKEYPYTTLDSYTFTTTEGGAISADQKQEAFDKVNVFPNPLFAFNPQTSYDNSVNPDDPFVTFNHLPEDVTIRIFSLSGNLLRTLNSDDKSVPTSQFLAWDLKNEDGLRVASGLYIALIESPEFGEKVLKFSVILPQKQLRRY